MQNVNEQTNEQIIEKKEQKIALIVKILQSANLSQLGELEVFIITYLM